MQLDYPVIVRQANIKSQRLTKLIFSDEYQSVVTTDASCLLGNLKAMLYLWGTLILIFQSTTVYSSQRYNFRLKLVLQTSAVSKQMLGSTYLETRWIMLARHQRKTILQATTTAVNSIRMLNTANTVAEYRQWTNERMNKFKQFKMLTPLVVLVLCCCRCRSCVKIICMVKPGF